jgi:hypothetical protein
VDADPAERRVGPREVDVLEDAGGVRAARHRLGVVAAVVVDPDHLAGQDVAHHLCPDEVERAGLRGEHVVVADAAERQGPDTEGVAEGDERPVRDRDDRVGAAQPAHRRGDRLRERRRVVREERGDHLGVGGRPEPHARGEQLVAERRRVDEVPVVPERDRARGAVVHDRLGVRPVGAARRRVAGVADRDLAGQRGELLLVEDVRDEAHLAEDGDPRAVGDGDPRGLLATVLQREEPEVREARDVALARVDAEHAAHQPRAPS